MARLEHEEGLTGCAFLKRPRSCHTFVATSTESESVSLWAARRDPAQARVGHLEQAHTDRVSRYVFVYFFKHNFSLYSVYVQCESFAFTLTFYLPAASPPTVTGS